MQAFRNLKVWEKAHILTLDIYKSSRTFPREETYGLTSQMRRSSASIGANLDIIEPLLISYAAHALGTSVVEMGNNASEKDRAMQRTWAAILALACNRSGATVERSTQALEEAV